MEHDEKEIRERSEKHSKLQTLMHYVNNDSLMREHALQSGNKASGVDRVTKSEYGQQLDENIEDLLKRMRSFSYRPKPVRRTYIPKANGKVRPLGIPSYEDKLVQGAMARVLNSVYEPRFLDCSYGFRPQKSCHDVIRDINRTITKNISYEIEVGGKNKIKKQLQGVPNGYIFKDGIEIGYGNVIPLYLVGFLY